jgi:hypothetical protein
VERTIKTPKLEPRKKKKVFVAHSAPPRFVEMIVQFEFLHSCADNGEDSRCALTCGYR